MEGGQKHDFKNMNVSRMGIREITRIKYSTEINIFINSCQVRPGRYLSRTSKTKIQNTEKRIYFDFIPRVTAE